MLNPFEMFTKIYCINLDSRPDRWEKCQYEFAKMGIAHLVERVSGIVYTDFEDQKRNACMGNHLSHAYCMFRAQQEHATSCLIFEDDVEFFYDKDTTYKILTNALFDLYLWDMFYLGINLDRWQAKQVTNYTARLFGGFSTHAYAVSDWMFDKLIEINSNINIVHNDVYYAENIMPTHNVYVTVPLLCGQREDFSTIEGKVMASNQMFLDRFEKGLIRLQ